MAKLRNPSSTRLTRVKPAPDLGQEFSRSAGISLPVTLTRQARAKARRDGVNLSTVVKILLTRYVAGTTGALIPGITDLDERGK